MSRRTLRTTSVAVVLSATAIAIACADSPTADATTVFKGSKIAVGQGTAWTEMVVGQANDIQEVSLVFTDEALIGLPGTLPATEFIVPLPSDAPATRKERRLQQPSSAGSAVFPAVRRPARPERRWPVHRARKPTRRGAIRTRFAKPMTRRASAAMPVSVIRTACARLTTQ